MGHSAAELEPKNRFFLTAYMAQFVVPLFFLADISLSWRVPSSLGTFTPATRWWYDFGAVSQLVFVVCALWLAVGVGAILLSRIFRLFPTNKLQGPLVAVYALGFSLGVVELFLQVLPAGEVQPALWPPGHEALLKPDHKLMPGVHGAATFTGNEAGLRGTPLPEGADVYKIVTIGGSTTETLYLDDLETWPHLLMEEINAHRSEVRVWVGNGGQSGRNMVDHLTLIQSLPSLGEMDMFVFLVGLNELQPTLSLEGGPTQELLERNTENFRAQLLRGGKRSRPPWPFFKHTRLYDLVRNSSLASLARFAPTSIIGQFGVGPGINIQVKRQQRAQGPVVPLPDLETGLAEYRQRIRALARECQKRGTRCLFLTQPTMWRDDLRPDEERLLWFGWVHGPSQPTGYVPAEELAQAMDTYNETLLTVCRQDGLECYDLASSVPKDTSAFYDDAHFNEGGARIVAELLADYLSSSPPFTRTGD